jgi:phosphopantetheinyl transferase
LPILFQHTINKDAQLSIWKIEESESFFINVLPAISLPSHPHRRLQHLAGRYLLAYMQPDFPFEMIVSAQGTKPFVSDDSLQFSISHSGDVAAAIISQKKNVGIDIEYISDKAKRIAHKFLSEFEMDLLHTKPESESYHCTLAWSIKETIFKWYGLGNVDFRKDIQIKSLRTDDLENTAECFFRQTDQMLHVNFIRMNNVVLSWLI